MSDPDDLGYEILEPVPAGPEPAAQPTPTVEIPVSVVETSSGERSPDVRRATDYANRLRLAVGKISEVSDSSVRAVLDLYFPLINPRRVRQGQQFFPRAVHRHARNDERSAGDGGKINLLFFHVGNAILGIYESVLAAGTPMFDVECTALGDKVRLIEHIAMYGLAVMFYVGDDSRGFALQVDKPASDVPKPNLAPDAGGNMESSLD